jgi:Ca2+-transporting ATPase
LFSKGATINIICDALVIAILTLISFFVGGATMAFSTLALVQIFHSFNMKTHDSLLKADFKSNKFMNFTTLIALSVIILFVLTPVGRLFGIVRLAFGKFLLSLLLSLLIIPLCEIKKFASREIAKKIF